MGSGSSGCFRPKVNPGSDTPKVTLPDEKIDLLLQSWIDVKEYGAENIAAIAFKELFRLAPETQKMFSDFSDERHLDGNKLFMMHCKIVMKFIGSSIGLLREHQSFHSSSEFLGLKHSGFKITDNHFQIFGEQFILSMRACLKEDFPAPVEEAWKDYYNLLAVTIQTAVKEYEQLMSQENFNFHGTKSSGSPKEDEDKQNDPASQDG